MTRADPLAAAAALLTQFARAGLRPHRPSAPAAPAVLPDLAQIALEVAGCTRCPLAATRTCTVPGEGHPRARLMVIGEGPGADEDRSGRPFVGAAGQLLDRILAQGMGLPRADVFIANVVKCRPPGNRDPALEEVAACTPFLERQIAAIGPSLILALGRHAAHHLLATEAPLSRLRGRVLPRPQGGPPVLVTFHPAYLLRNPEAKRDCWADVQVALEFLGLPRPSRPSPTAASGNQAAPDA